MLIIVVLVSLNVLVSQKANEINVYYNISYLYIIIIYTFIYTIYLFV